MIVILNEAKRNEESIKVSIPNYLISKLKDSSALLGMTFSTLVNQYIPHFQIKRFLGFTAFRSE